VAAIANAPQKHTLIIPLTTFAPPALAPMAPKSARNASDAAVTIQTSLLVGEMIAMSSGIAAPTANVAADVSELGNPKFIARTGTQCVLRHQLVGNLAGQVNFNAAFDIVLSEFFMLERSILSECLPLTVDIGLLSVRL
jgi:hypothetical protein